MNLDPKKFDELGYLGPIKLFDSSQATSLLEDKYIPTELVTWYKATHEKSALVRRTATSPIILSTLRSLLGNDIILWGSHFIKQKPEQAHGWHLDVEYGRWNGVTLWLGLKNLNSKTTVSVITRSHLLPVVPNELHKNRGVDILDDNAILKEAKKLDPRCELKTFTLNVGEFVIWSGRAWHATSNKSNKTRHSIIMQFCTPENVPKIPLNYEYPDTKWSDVQPPCILVSGEDKFHLNKMLVAKDLEDSSELIRRLNSKVYKAKYYWEALSRRVEKLLPRA